MTRIDAVSLMELFEATLMKGEAPDVKNPAAEPWRIEAESCFVEPSLELMSGVISLEDLLGDVPDLFEATARQLGEAGQARAQGALRELAEFLRTHGDDLHDEAGRSARLLDYVYTVV